MEGETEPTVRAGFNTAVYTFGRTQSDSGSSTCQDPHCEDQLCSLTPALTCMALINIRIQFKNAEILFFGPAPNTDVFFQTLVSACSAQQDGFCCLKLLLFNIVSNLTK